MKQLSKLLTQDSDSFNEKLKINIKVDTSAINKALKRLCFDVGKLAIVLMFKQEERFQSKLDIAFYSIIALNLICLTIAIVRL